MQGGGIAIRFTGLVEVATEEVMGLLNDPNIAKHMPLEKLGQLGKATNGVAPPGLSPQCYR